jgi:hypothetical protein
MGRAKDILASRTEKYVPDEKSKDKKTNDDDDEGGFNITIDLLYAMVSDENNTNINVNTSYNNEHIDLSELTRRGNKGCGWKNIAQVTQKNMEEDWSLIENSANQEPESEITNNNRNENLGKETIHMDDMVELLGQRVERVINTSRPIESQDIDITANGTCESIILWGKHYGNFDDQQQRAFEIIAGTFVLTYFEDVENNRGTINLPRTRGMYGQEKKKLKHMVFVEGRLVMFLTGAGGSGKSAITKQLLLYGKPFCDNLGCSFTEKTILMTALTGVAATLINGETLHGAVHLNTRLSNISQAMIDAFSGVKFLIIDEISFASAADIKKLDSVLRKLTQNNSKYGGLSVIFMGDFSQLPPINAIKIYETQLLPQWYEWINCFVELFGQWRFKDDMAYGQCLSRFRMGKPTQSDFELINKRVIVSAEELPENVTYAVHTNRDRDAINTGAFNKYLDCYGPSKAVLILSDKMKIRSNTHGEFPLKDCAIFWSMCGESDCVTAARQRLDPVLKLYPGCKVMLTSNANVKGGEANGSTGSILKINLKPNKNQFTMKYGNCQIQAVFASDVNYIALKLDIKPDMAPKKIQPQKFNFDCKYPLPEEFHHGRVTTKILKMKAVQLPFVSCTAVTGHKLQGATKDHLFIPFWHYGTKNWPYVMMSRVRTRAGLFLGEPLNQDKDFEIDSRIPRMLRKFQAKTPSSLT